MKGFTQAALAAILVAGAAAQPHVHKHRHAKGKRHEHVVVEKRDAVTVTSVVAATVTEYVLDGVVMDLAQAEAGINGGDYVVVGSSTPTFTSPSPSSTSTTASSSSTEAAQFLELKSSSSSAPSSSSSSSSPAPSSTSATATNGSAATATGLNVPFPTGDDAPSCDFPSAYGAVPVDWLGTDGWSSLQQPADAGFTLGEMISDIIAPTSGGCEPGMFCSYACPPGYQKSQWPVDSQGTSGQSVGGLYCDSNGKLQLTRPTHPYICEQGAGGVSIKNSLTEQVSVCRTDYPGSEAMVIPLAATAGGTFPLTNPDSATYYVWEGKSTTAQYYINPSGLSVEDACVWTSPTNPTSAGNWAPMNIGVGQDSTGTTYLSIFNNSPTSSATLNFNVRITGDVSVECTFENGAYTSGDGSGCTVSFP